MKIVGNSTERITNTTRLQEGKVQIKANIIKQGQKVAREEKLVKTLTSKQSAGESGNVSDSRAWTVYQQWFIFRGLFLNLKQILTALNLDLLIITCQGQQKATKFNNSYSFTFDFQRFSFNIRIF